MGLFDTFTLKANAVSSLLGLQQRIVLHVVTSLSMHAACSMLHPLLLRGVQTASKAKDNSRSIVESISRHFDTSAQYPDVSRRERCRGLGRVTRKTAGKKWPREVKVGFH